MSEFDLDIRITEGPQGSVEPARSYYETCTYFCYHTYLDCTTACTLGCTNNTCASECVTCCPGVREAGPQCI